MGATGGTERGREEAQKGVKVTATRATEGCKGQVERVWAVFVKFGGIFRV